MYLISGLTRNELMASGLKDLAPGLTSNEIGYLSRVLFPLFDGDPTGVSISVFQEKIYQEVMNNIVSANEEVKVKIADIMCDFWTAKLRGK